MKPRIAVLMDPIQKIKIHKDSTFAMMLEAQRRGYELHVLEQSGLMLRDGRAYLRTRRTRVADDPQRWFEQDAATVHDAGEFAFVLMRKDPPFDAEYLYDTHILERAEAAGVTVVNRPQALRDANEKLFTALFPQCCAPTLVAREAADLRAFVAEHGDCVAKVLDAMGGASVFRLQPTDPNLNVILETVTAEGRRAAMVQRYIPAISAGDKRILLIDGEPVPYALARIPKAGEFRGNLARGGTGRAQPLSERDRWIAAEIGPELRRRGLYFVGLDVIGDYLTEVNVTSPTCIRELDAACGINIAGMLFDRLEALRQ
jgi:glutathione synthase